MLVGLLRYAHVIEKHENSILNTFGLLTAWICAAGLIMVGNFQVASLITAAQLVTLIIGGRPSAESQEQKCVYQWRLLISNVVLSVVMSCRCVGL